VTSGASNRSVLVVGDDSRASLAICRSLGRAGNRVSLLRFSDASSPADASRYCAQSLCIGQPVRGVSAWRQRFRTLLRKGGYTHVLPVDELAHELICPMDAEASGRPIRVGPSTAAHRLAADRASAYALAAEAGWRVIGSVRLSLADTAPEMQFPCVVRPLRAAAIDGDEPASYSTKLIHDANGLDAKLRDDLSRIDVLIQSPLHGDRVDLCLAAMDGSLLALAAARRMDPDGAVLVSEASSKEAQARSRDLASRLGWTGLLRIECVRQEDELNVLDIRPGPGDLLSVAMWSGVDLPRLLLDGIAAHSSVALAVSSAGVRVRHLATSLRNLRRVPPERAHRRSLSVKPAAAHKTYLETEWIADPRPAVAQLTVMPDKLARFALDRWRALSMATRVGSRVQSKLRRSDSVLFVCQGNINRSVVAEHILRSKGFTRVASAGLLVMSGRRPSRPAEQFIVERLGLPAAAIRSQSVHRAFASAQEFDVIVCFERRHLVEMLRFDRALRQRLVLLSQLGEDARGSTDVADPHGGSPDEYQACFERISRLLDRAVEEPSAMVVADKSQS